jgi:hypothetical protein
MGKNRSRRKREVWRSSRAFCELYLDLISPYFVLFRSFLFFLVALISGCF